MNSKKTKPIYVRLSETELKKLKEIKEEYSRKEYINSNEITNSKLIKEAIRLLHFTIINKEYTGEVFETIITANNSYFRKRDRVENEFKNELVTNLLVNQELLKILLEKNGTDYKEVRDVVIKRIEDKIISKHE